MTKKEALTILRNNLELAEVRRCGEIERRDFDAARRTEWRIDDIRTEINKWLEA